MLNTVLYGTVTTGTDDERHYIMNNRNGVLTMISKNNKLVTDTGITKESTHLKTEQNPFETDQTVIKITHLTKEYSQWQRSGKTKDIIMNIIHPEKRVITALDDVTLNIEKGAFVAYAGANGAGKSTTLKILSGILQPTSGSVEVLGMNPAKARIALMKRVGILFGQRTELWWDHPVATSFDWKATVWDIPKEQYNSMRKLVVELLEMEDLMHTFVRELSLGQRMRADLALMLLHEPELILLDEPTLGLDVLAKRHMIDFLKRINREKKTTIIVTSHDMDDLEEMAQRIVLLSSGKVAFDGSFDTLRTITGNLRYIILTTNTEDAPGFQSAKWVSSNENVHEYAFDAAEITIPQMLEEVSTMKDVIDMETRKAPIEKVIAGLYQQWNGK